MKTIKQAPGSKDCVACVAAMATETTVEQYKKFCEQERLDPTRDIAFIRYLFENGYGVGAFAPEDNLFKISHLKNVDLLKAPAYIIVESDQEWVKQQGASHVLYWDGAKHHDPSPDVDWPLNHYKVIGCLNIVKIASHPRWKDEY